MLASVMYRPIGDQASRPGVRDTEVVQAFPPPLAFDSSELRRGSPKREEREGGRPAVRLIGDAEQELYARVAAEGWRDSGYGDFMLEIGRVSANTDGLYLFVAERDGGAIAAGAEPYLIFPIDGLPLGREIGQILPSDALVQMRRISTTSVMLEADSRATLAFVFQVPERSATRAFRLPDGSELALTR